MLILPVFLALLLALTGCMGMMGYVLTPTPTPTIAPTATPTPTPTPTPKPTPTPTPSVTREPIPQANLDSFVNGENDAYGYRSRFFRFGFYVPLDWSVYTREVVNELNDIDRDITDLEEVRLKTIKRLKMSDTVVDFVSFYGDTQGHVFIFVIDLGDSAEPVDSEQEALAYFEETMFGPDSTSRKINLDKTIVNLGGKDHPVYRYDVIVDQEQRLGATFAIMRGTTFAVVQIEAQKEDDIEHIFRSFYSLD